MIDKLRSNWQPVVAVILLALVLTALAVFRDYLPKYEQPKPDPERAYYITVENTPNAPLLDDDYYCAYYKLEGRTLTMYAADSTVKRVVLINVNANCKIRKTY